MSPNKDEPRIFETYIANGQFHHVFHLPLNPSQGRTEPLRITYADYGYQDDAGTSNEAVILILGPMISTRYLHIAKDKLAKEHKVRLIHPDRFGFGGSTEVNADKRVAIWLELVPALLEHLNIKHVFLMAQSGGTIYALNTILYQRHLLHPTQPYLALGAPWVHPSHSGATAMSLMKIFPDALFANIDSFAQWFRNNIAPATGFSENIVASVGASIGNVFHKKTTPDKPTGEASGEEEAAFKFDEDIRPIAVDMAYAENVQGLSQEALLFLKRGNTYDWGPWEDYDRYVPLLADSEKALKKPDAQKLKIDVFFAETDVMIGNTNGPKWFDRCWEMGGEEIEYGSRFVKGADHDGIFNIRWGAVQQVFAEVRRKATEG